MKAHTTVLLVFLAVFALALGCGAEKGGEPAKKGADTEKEGGKEGGEAEAEKPAEPAKPKEGAESPEKIFEGLKKVLYEDGSVSETLKFVIPDERCIMAMGLDMFSGMVFMGMDEEAKKKAEAELADIRKTHKIPEKKGEIDPAALQDPEKMKALGAEMYAGVDIVAYLADLTAFMGKHSDKASEKPKNAATALKDVKVEGDEAKGTLEFADGSTKAVTFKKIDGRWYIPIQAIQGN
jgi:hypothetical protein